jgi:hypothetical protein
VAFLALRKLSRTGKMDSGETSEGSDGLAQRIEHEKNVNIEWSPTHLAQAKRQCILWQFAASRDPGAS